MHGGHANALSRGHHDSTFQYFPSRLSPIGVGSIVSSVLRERDPGLSIRGHPPSTPSLVPAETGAASSTGITAPLTATAAPGAASTWKTIAPPSCAAGCVMKAALMKTHAGICSPAVQRLVLPASRAPGVSASEGFETAARSGPVPTTGRVSHVPAHPRCCSHVGIAKVVEAVRSSVPVSQAVFAPGRAHLIRRHFRAAVS